MIDTRLIWVLPATLALAWLLTLVSERLAFVLGLVDKPGGSLKIHQKATPRFGGFAVIVALWGVHLTGKALGLEIFTRPQLIVATLLFGLGTWDDFASRGAVTRLVLQALIFAIAWNLGIRVEISGTLWLDFVLSLALFIVVINATNFYDGMDGLLSLCAICALGVWAVVAAESGFAWWPAAASAAVLLGFLPRNWSPARTFLGDGGSLVVGFLFYLTFTGPGGTSVWPGFWVCAVPVCDAVAATLDRMRRHGNVFQGDRDHVYDILARLGLSTAQVSLLLGLLAAITARGTQLVTESPLVERVISTVGLYTLLVFVVLFLRHRFRLPDSSR